MKGPSGPERTGAESPANAAMNPAPPESIDRILFSEEDIRRRCAELGAAISRDYAGLDLTLVSVLKGAVYFVADLTRRIAVPHEIDFMAVSGYAGAEAKGGVKIVKDLDRAVAGRHVLVVEDVIDTGLTLSYLLKNLRQREPASVEVCALLDKTRRRIADIPIKYRAFEIEEAFVVGYGMDVDELHRNLPFICVMKGD